MKTFLILSTFLLAAGGASAQVASETTTTQTTAMPAPVAGTLSTTRETHAVDAYGNRVDSKATSFSNGAGVTHDSTVTTTNVAPPPPPLPPVTTTTSSSSTTTTTAVPN